VHPPLKRLRLRRNMRMRLKIDEDEHLQIRCQSGGPAPVVAWQGQTSWLGDRQEHDIHREHIPSRPILSFKKARIRHPAPNTFLRGPFYLAKMSGGAPNVTSKPAVLLAVHPACCLATSRTHSPSTCATIQEPSLSICHARKNDSPCLLWWSQQCSHQVTANVLGNEQ
jgi:hypothetical protein